MALGSENDFINELREEYIENLKRNQIRDELIRDNNIEKSDIKGYHGREILELLQNADDAYQKSIDQNIKPDCECKVTIKYIDNILSVSNTGTSFDESGIKAIVQGNNSSKKGKYIGNKGTGFRSILNWSNRVRIFSGNFNIEFSKEIAQKEFEKIKTETQIRNQLEKNPHLYIPMLAVPINISKPFESNETIIEMEIDQNKINDNFSVEKQIENIDLRILLFLPNISEIEIITDSKHIIYKRKVNINNTRTLQKIVDNKIEIEENYYLFEKTIEKRIEEDNELKDVNLAIAIPQDFTINNWKLYSFFPLLGTISPFNCILHATYILGSNRNTIDFSDKNAEIIKEQLIFLVEVANDFVKKGRNDIAYKILVPNNFFSNEKKFSSPFDQFNLEDYYLELISKQRFFLTVNNKNISILDNPRMIKGDFPKVFKGTSFDKLLKPIFDNNVVNFIEELAIRNNKNVFLEENELKLMINSLSNNWTISEQIDVFLWWNEYAAKSLPNLLKKQDGNWLQYNEECFFLVGDFDYDLPSWANISSLDSAYQEILFKKARNTKKIQEIKEKTKEPQISRIICQNNIYATVDFKYRDRSNIILTVNSSVDTYEEAVEFVKWLWQNYRQEIDWNPPNIKEVKYNFPSLNKKIISSDKLYFGREYNNELAEKLFDIDFKAFPTLATFSIKDEDKKSFIDFITKFDVKKYPEIENQNVVPIKKYAADCEEKIKTTEEFGSSTEILFIKYNLPYIKNLDNILNELSMVEIIKWIINDNTLNTYLVEPLNTVKVTYKGNLHRREKEYSFSERNYILEVFNEAKWIEINNQKYSPREVLIDTISKNINKFSKIVPIINVEELAKKLNIGYETILRVISLFAFCEKLTDLDSNAFYGLMLSIPFLENIALSEELSRTIYRLVEQPSFKKEFLNSVNKEKFMREGKMLVKFNGLIQYKSIKESYLPSTRIINKKTVPIIEKGQRTSNDNFVKVFGCQEYKKDSKISLDNIEISEKNNEFQNYFMEFKKYAYAYYESNENINKHAEKIEITLVKSIEVVEDKERFNVDEEYMCIRDKMTKWYIIFFETDFNIGIDKLSETIENIYANIANTPGFDASRIGELFRTKEKERREFLIKKDFGSLDVIKKEPYQNEIRNSFIETLTKICPTYQIENLDIDFDDFASTDNIIKIISLFRTLKIDIKDFKDFIYNIDLVAFYKDKLKDYIYEKADNYKNCLFAKAKKDVNLQNNFISLINDFKSLDSYEILNSVNFDVEKLVNKKFDNLEKNISDVSADKEYNRNYEIMNPNKLYEDIIANDTKVQQMIYFFKKDDFRNWLDYQRELEIKNNDNKSDDYDKYRDFVPVMEEIEYIEKKEERKDYKDKKSNYHGTYTKSSDEKRMRNQKKQGNKGELLVYNYLCKKFGKDNVIPISEAFVELGIIKPGQAKSGEYDISYIDKEGNLHFVEVKTGDGQSFIITPGELAFAKDNNDKYELYLVYDLDDNPKIHPPLPKSFWNDEKFIKNEIVERIEFKF